MSMAITWDPYLEDPNDLLPVLTLWGMPGEIVRDGPRLMFRDANGMPSLAINHTYEWRDHYASPVNYAVMRELIEAGIRFAVVRRLTIGAALDLLAAPIDD